MPHKTKEKKAENPVVAPAKFSLQEQKAALNPTLSSLFASSSGPIKSYIKYAPTLSSKSRVIPSPAPRRDALDDEKNDEVDDEELSEASESFDDEADLPSELDGEDEGREAKPVPDPTKSIKTKESLSEGAEAASRKRKRNRDNEDLEGVYMQRLAREEAKEEAQRQSDRQSKRQKQDDGDDEAEVSGVVEDEIVPDGNMDDLEDVVDVPQHETLAGEQGETEVEKASRTVFLANVSTTAITSKSDKKMLLTHLASFIPALAPNDPPHKVESIRFRSTAYSSNVPKKAAFAKKELMDTTTKSTNAYVVYSTNKAAREAALKLNGTVVLGRHLRVDEVAHPAKIDHKRCVFVGNLGFVDDDTQIKAAAAELAGKTNARPSKSQAGDVEEGLWQQFGTAGKVESVRVVRDPTTRVGKGFAYVQFTDQNGVEAALLFNDKKYPPLLPRKLRVVRAKRMFKKLENPSSRNRGNGATGNDKKPTRPDHQSHLGRAKKLLGRAGAAATARDSRGTASNSVAIGQRGDGGKPAIRAPETFVFEGHRASSTQGKGALRLGKGKGGKKKAGKPRDRSAKRGAAWKAQGGRSGGGSGGKGS